jgi:hypothetical protein
MYRVKGQRLKGDVEIGDQFDPEKLLFRMPFVEKVEVLEVEPKVKFGACVELRSCLPVKIKPECKLAGLCPFPWNMAQVLDVNVPAFIRDKRIRLTNQHNG